MFGSAIYFFLPNALPVVAKVKPLHPIECAPPVGSTGQAKWKRRQRSPRSTVLGGRKVRHSFS